MLLESDNSMMAMSSGGASAESLEAFSPTSGMPSFRAAGVQQSGIADAVGSVPVNAVNGRQIGASQPATEGSYRRALPDDKWQLLEQGLHQRFEAVSACMEEIVSRRNTPSFLKQSSYLPTAVATLLQPIDGTAPADVAWTWLGSTDIHWASTGELTVLDHDFSLPTGLEKLARTEDATAMAGVLFSAWTIGRNDDIAQAIAVLDPGFFSTTFRGNEFLARCLNAHLVRSSDLTIESDGVFLKSGQRLIRISTIVRRIEDDLLDPNCFRPDSLVGLPGLMRAWKNGLVKVMSPPGSGFANSRSFGRMIPQMIRELLNEEPLLNSVEVSECGIDDVLQNVITNPERYAIRTNDPRHPARPYFGRDGAPAEFSNLLVRIRKNPSAFVVRPLLPTNSDTSTNLRVFATGGRSFRLLRAAIGRDCQPDGGAAVSIGSDSPTVTIL